MSTKSPKRRRVAPSGDRRSVTSPQNIAAFIPPKLSERGSVTVAVRIPVETAEALDKARGKVTRGEYMRELLQERLGQ